MADDIGENVTLLVDGFVYGGWTKVQIEFALDAISGRFSLELTAREATGMPRWPLAAGQTCEVRVDGVTIITGRIDVFAPSVDAEQAGIVVTGRDRAAVLEDASAVHRPGHWRDTPMRRIFTELTQPFDIDLAFDDDVDADRPLRKFALQQGESVWSALERLLRLRGAIAWSQSDGSVRIGTPHDSRILGALIEGENIKAMAARHDISQRFSEYIVKGQSAGGDDRNGDAVTGPMGKASDPAIGWHRPLIIIAEDQADKASLERRAIWESVVRAARGQEANITVPGWRNIVGALWTIGDQATVRAPAIAIDSDMLITGLVFERGPDGTLTTLTLQPPEAWLPQPITGTDPSALNSEEEAI